MHLFAPEVGMMGTSGIVGPCILQAAGAGYSFKLLKTRPRRGRVLRRRGGQQRRVPRGAEPRRHLEAAGAVRLREQPVRHRGAVRLRRRQPERGVARRGLRHARRRTSTATTCWPSARPPARRSRRRRAGERADAARVQDLPHAAARRGHGRLHLPHARGGRGVEDDAARSSGCATLLVDAAARERELDAIDAEVAARGRRRPHAPPRRARGPTRRRPTTHVYAEPRARRRPRRRRTRARSITFIAGDARSARARRWRANPRHLRAGRGHRQARRQLQDDRRAVRPVRPRAAARHADLRARLRRPGVRRGDDRHAAGRSTSCSPTSSSTASARSSTRSPRCST